MIATMKPILAHCAADLMSRDLIVISEKMSLRGAARILSRADISGAPVVDHDGKVVGVLSATDFLRLAKDGATPLPCTCRENTFEPWQMLDHAKATEATVAQVMTKNPVTAPTNTPITELARMMLDAHIHRVILVDTMERPVGVVTSTDILAAIGASRIRKGIAMKAILHPKGESLKLDLLTAADLMAPNPISISADANVQEALMLLTDKNFSAAPVIDVAGRPVGVISRSDLLVHDREQGHRLNLAPAYFSEPEPRPEPRKEPVKVPDGFQVENVDLTTVGDIMTPALFSVAPDTPASKVVTEMTGLHVHRLFVVDDMGTLVGVISTMDVLKRLRPA